jgi:hypothetical protein
MLPGGANHAISHHPWISVILKRVWAEEVRDDLPIVVCKQGGLRREEYPGEAGGVGTDRCGRVWARHADVILGADGVTIEERLASRWHLNVRGYRWRCDMAGAGRLRQRDRKSHGESSGARDEQDTRLGPMLGSIAIIHTILLVRLLQSLSGWSASDQLEVFSMMGRLVMAGAISDAEGLSRNFLSWAVTHFRLDQCRLSEKVAVKQILRCVLRMTLERSCHPERSEGSAFTLSLYPFLRCADAFGSFIRS